MNESEVWTFYQEIFSSVSCLWRRLDIHVNYNDMEDLVLFSRNDLMFWLLIYVDYNIMGDLHTVPGGYVFMKYLLSVKELYSFYNLYGQINQLLCR